MRASSISATSGAASYPDEGGLLPWLFTLDHKRVALLQLAGVLLAILFGSGLAAAMTAERLLQVSGDLSRARFGSAMTAHGVVMVFLVVLPGLAATLGSFLMPLQLGARNVAFPRLHLASLYLWGIAALYLVHSVLSGTPEVGWRLAPPLALAAGGGLKHLAIAIGLLAGSAALRSVTFLVTIHQQRRQGLTWSQLPPLSLTVYAQSAVQLIGAPVLILTLILLLAEQHLGTGLFDPKNGGDPSLYTHFFWFGTHALLYSCALPAAGVIAEVLKTSARRPLFAPRSLRASVALFAVLTLLGYAVHLSSRSGSVLTAALGSLPTLLLGVPVSLFFLVWLGTLRKGRIVLSGALLAALGAATCWFVGAASGLLLAVPSLSSHLGGTVFVTAHAHYLTVGGIGLSALAGLFLWWPRIAGRTLPEPLARLSAVLWAAGVHVTFFPQLVLGSRGLPRAMAALPTDFALLQWVSVGGMLVLIVGLSTAMAALVTARRGRDGTTPNPLGLQDLECASPRC